MKHNEITAYQQHLNSFLDLYTRGIELWAKAGEVLVAMLDENPNACEDIIKACPRLNPEILGRFEQMGRKTLHPRLLVESSSGFDRLAKMPLSVQTRHLEEPIPMVVETEKGTDVLMVHARNMTLAQAKQVFAGTHIRSEGEQRAWLVGQRAKNFTPAKSTNGEPPWRIRNGRVEFLAGCTMTAGELSAVLTQIIK